MMLVTYYWGDDAVLVGEVTGDAYINDGIEYLPLRVTRVLVKKYGSWPQEAGYPVSCLRTTTARVYEDSPARAGNSSR